MLVNYLIGLREGLEAALVVSVIVAYLVQSDRRQLLPKVWIGVGISIVATVALGAILTYGPYGLAFQAQEIIGGLLSILAVGFITWMILWMAKVSKDLSGELRAGVDAAIDKGGVALVLMAALAVIREGIETTLFLWATVGTSGGNGVSTLAAVAGILTACVLGWLIYRGFVRVRLQRFFAWTGGLLVLVAAGVLAYGIGDLQEAGVLPGVGVPAYSLEHLLSANSSFFGSLLAGLVNYTAEPTWLQVIAWWAYLIVVLPIFVFAVRQRRAVPQPQHS